MRLPPTKKILREDVKDAPAWITAVIDPINSFMESVYQTLNQNVTFSQNIASFVKNISYVTPSTYPVMDDVKFINALKTKATGVLLLQVVDHATYVAPRGPISIPWVEDSGNIVISSIPGLEAGKTYDIRLLVI